MAKKTNGESLHFNGTPHRLVARVSLQGAITREALTGSPLEVKLGNAMPAPVLLPPRIRAADPSAAILKLRLPRSTPPGRYEGAAQIGDGRARVVADVHPLHRLRATPSSASMEVTAGKPMALLIQLANLGNVVSDIQPRYTFCVFDGSGVDRAFFVALAEDPPDGERRIDRLMDELAAHHGGLVRLDVAEGAGKLSPGEQRSLRLELRFSDRMRPGRTYAGIWEVENLRFAIRAEVAAVETRTAEEAR